ncbi:MAG: hypothetical protein VZQ95_04040 [Erysipelotrichaceae bacterium]|nr:hypothetical protein [Erysipelotrichaceae bacterium]MBQ2656357.1 hypothetical protein [Erysipelotrichaceae bacterium]MBQ3994853.1 hypothetical protein [Erysipelotrichaceae bacterium]MEE3408541.1 hypothetical protein [Erysipelotrichaceae bacterium]MEE3424886.1 hypothetical protein [Erysipelotrichaceae bacterium]
MGLFDGFKKKAEEAKQATVAKAEEAKKDIDTLAKEVVDGRWGSTDQEIKQKLEAAGYDTYLQVKSKANSLIKAAADAKAAAEAAAKAAAKKAEEAREAAKAARIEELAKEVIQGKWGNGQERKDKLTAAGYDYSAVQGKVNELLNSGKDLETVAKEVIQGKWGNGQERKDKLTAAGYNYSEVQALVNKLLG